MSKEKWVDIDFTPEEESKIREVMAAKGIPQSDFDEFVRDMIEESTNEKIIAWEWKNGDMKRHKFK